MSKIKLKYFVYILRCADNSLYCGYTKNLKKRVAQHNSSTQGAKYTKSRRPVSLAYFEKYRTVQKAMQRELEIKKLRKVKKEKLVNKNQN